MGKKPTSLSILHKYRVKPLLPRKFILIRARKSMQAVISHHSEFIVRKDLQKHTLTDVTSRMRLHNNRAQQRHTTARASMETTP
jgi:hypothetical protein